MDKKLIGFNEEQRQALHRLIIATPLNSMGVTFTQIQPIVNALRNDCTFAIKDLNTLLEILNAGSTGLSYSVTENLVNTIMESVNRKEKGEAKVESVSAEEVTE